MSWLPKFFVYALIDPRTEEVRYIGKTQNGMSRPIQHAHKYPLLKCGNQHKVSWIRDLQANGLKYRVAILDMLEEPTGLYELEQYWIARGRASGWPLTNLTDGGPGACGIARSAETRAKISAAKTGKKQGPYKPRSAEHSAKLGAARRGKKHTPEHNRKISAALLANREELSRRAKELWSNRSWAERQRISRLGSKMSEETRAKMRASQSERRRRERHNRETCNVAC